MSSSMVFNARPSWPTSLAPPAGPGCGTHRQAEGAGAATGAGRVDAAGARRRQLGRQAGLDAGLGQLDRADDGAAAVAQLGVGAGWDEHRRPAAPSVVTT